MYNQYGIKVELRADDLTDSLVQGSIAHVTHAKWLSSPYISGTVSHEGDDLIEALRSHQLYSNCWNSQMAVTWVVYRYDLRDHPWIAPDERRLRQTKEDCARLWI